jgi:uncharacterized protein
VADGWRKDQLLMSEEEIRAIVGYPAELTLNKVISSLDDHCKTFIANSPFLTMATSGEGGMCDVSPRGDRSGFVLILDDSHIVIPERPGNRRLDSILNILANPHIGLLFMIPGKEETLRINGQAYVTKDPDLLRRMTANNTTPLLGIGVKVQECFIHCAKAFIRSQLWHTDSWSRDDRLASPAKILADHASLHGFSQKEVEELLIESYTKRLY